MNGRKGLPLIDVLPEYFPYRDDGCEVSPSCLSCPLPRCKYDYDEEGRKGWLQRRAREKRAQQVMGARSRGETVSQLARRFNVSERTIHRIIKLARKDGREEPA